MSEIKKAMDIGDDLSPYRALEDRFWKKTDIRGEKECWPWLGSKGGGGYGTLYFEGKNVRATRIAWSLRYRVPFPDELHACHVCDNPACCNPAHIWPGTRSQNFLDASRKGRLYVPTMPAMAKINAAKTHCKHGHALTPENVFITSQGRRACRACKAAYSAKWSRKNREKVLAARRVREGGKVE